MTATTVNRTSYDTAPRGAFGGPALNAQVWSHELATTSIDEAADAVNMGYLPAGVTLIGFFAYLDDVDSSTGLVWKITVGSTDARTGMTIGQADAKVTHTLTQFLAIDPYVTTDPTLVKFVVTTPATTPVAGTLVLTPVYLAA
jgi:hypothetical protein